MVLFSKSQACCDMIVRQFRSCVVPVRGIWKREENIRTVFSGVKLSSISCRLRTFFDPTAHKYSATLLRHLPLMTSIAMMIPKSVQSWTAREITAAISIRIGRNPVNCRTKIIYVGVVGAGISLGPNSVCSCCNCWEVDHPEGARRRKRRESMSVQSKSVRTPIEKLLLV